MDPVTLVIIAVALSGYGLISRRAERSPLTAPIFFVAVGLALGDGGLAWLRLDLSGGAIHGLAELSLVLVLFTDASRIRLSCLVREHNLPARLLGIGLPLCVLSGAAAAALLFPDLALAEMLLVGAILAPTDAALGQAVVSNPLVPVRIRQSLNVESGLNDGIVLPVVLIIAATAGSASRPDLLPWLRFAVLAVTLGPLVGWAVGLAGGRLLTRATRSGWVNGAFQRLAALGLALLAFAGAEVVGGNGFIAAFVAGLTLGNSAREVCECMYEFGEAEGQLLTLLVFLLFGAVMVPEALGHANGAMLLYALLSLTLVRMLPVAVSLWGAGLLAPTVGFLGWFGPRGLASILFTLLVVERGDLANGAMVESIVVLTVLASTCLHGITAYPLASRYGRYASSHRKALAEREPAEEMPVRIRHAPVG